MSKSDITDQSDCMKNRRTGEREELKEGCLECAADVLSKVLDLSRPVAVPEELVQAAIRVFPVAPPPVKPSTAPALPLLAPRFPYQVENAQPEAFQVDAGSGDVATDSSPQAADPADAVVTVGASPKR